MTLTSSPVLALTPGEPAGIGPDICILLAQQPPCRLVLIADPDLMHARAAQLGLTLAAAPWQGREKPGDLVAIVPLATAAPVATGKLDTRNVPYVIDTLKRALAGCLAGEFDAWVTGPVHKGIINDAGIAFTGHTEFLAEGTGRRKVVMMLTDNELRVALATTHCPLAEVSSRITKPHLREVLRIVHEELQRRFGIIAPRILVCGLNPHAGESGHLGREEIEVITPVIEELRRAGLRLRGPVPADTAFTAAQLADVDAVLTMYHDQGLPVLKHRGFGHAVNITLGLPFVRTSVDHGTALELAGSGRADATSLLAAVQMACALIER
jgi:4-hydroxythreonine-4-phosphate dehydrogenase